MTDTTEVKTRRVLAVGQWLGTKNRIVSMAYYERTGWTATDSFGERYQQYPSVANRTPHPDGLKTADEPVSCVELLPTPWPPVPRDRSGEQPGGR